MRPPNDEVPASVPLSLILGETSGFVLALAGLSVYSNSFAFSIHLFLQDPNSRMVCPNCRFE
jgi:hypothetical protein